MGQCVKDTNLKQQTNCFWDSVLKIQTSGNRPRSNLNGEISRSLDYIRPGHLSEVLIMHHYNKNGNKDLHASIRMLCRWEKEKYLPSSILNFILEIWWLIGDVVADQSHFSYGHFLFGQFLYVTKFIRSLFICHKIYTVTNFIQ